MKLSPLVSIIIPNYNHSRFLIERLESVLSQTFQDFEVILLDDCSTDTSLDILKKYSNHPKVSHCVFNEVNSGNTFVQWGKGISLAQGEYIWIAESDDYCDTNFLEKLIQPFQNDDEVVLAYCQSNRVNERSELTGNWITQTDELDASLFLKDFVMDSNTFIERFLICRNVIPNASAVVFKKSAVDIARHIDVDAEYRHCGDWMFYMKLIINKKVAFVSDSLNNFRYHSNSVIAKLVTTEKRIYYIDIEIKIRRLMLLYLKESAVVNYSAIKRQNLFVWRNYLMYEKAFLLIRKGSTIKGGLLLLVVFDLFCKQYKFKKNLKIKFRRLFSN